MIAGDVLLNASSPTFKIHLHLDKKKPENRLRQMPTTSTTGNRVLQNIIIKNRIVATAIKQTLCLSNGPSISQFIGYVHFGNNKTINFHIGAEFIQAWTKSRRPFDFDRMQADTQKRFDRLWGIRVGWMLPLYKRTAKESYFY